MHTITLYLVGESPADAAERGEAFTDPDEAANHAGRHGGVVWTLPVTIDPRDVFGAPDTLQGGYVNPSELRPGDRFVVPWRSDGAEPFTAGTVVHGDDGRTTVHTPDDPRTSWGGLTFRAPDREGNNPNGTDDGIHVRRVRRDWTGV